MRRTRVLKNHRSLSSVKENREKKVHTDRSGWQRMDRDVKTKEKEIQRRRMAIPVNGKCEEEEEEEMREKD